LHLSKKEIIGQAQATAKTIKFFLFLLTDQWQDTLKRKHCLACFKQNRKSNEMQNPQSSTDFFT
jgi:hypothetical protein